VNRRDFKRLAQHRLREAEALLRARHFSGAFYLGGYAIECALKACIAKKTRRYDFPPRSVQEYYSHDFQKLVKAADLETTLDNSMNSNSTFRSYWHIVLKWSEQSRYQITLKQEAEALLEAVGDRNHGVLPWIKSLW
jgi:hypothetical protein